MPTFRTSSCKPIHPSVTLCVFTLLYALTAPLVEHIPNPMIPGAWLALNMIFPVLAGYFLGSLVSDFMKAADHWVIQAPRTRQPLP